ncbi:dimethylargininase [Streptomyces violaceus]|uniref:Amidinotransferase n=1 Tax=Streptomyces violaceus TaxID=1936 RepID=A0ABZ1P4R5_STRVL|nr:dimethylargininase [Streptomyces violaceus]
MLDQHSRVFRRRRYLMCPPTHFDVTYSINPWMDLSKPVDQRLAVTQWEELRNLYVTLGHTVELIDPLPGLPDMVFAANGATVVDGRVLAARFRNAERAAEGPAYTAWFRANGFPEVHESGHVNEGEGDYLVTGRWLLAGSGFRSDPAGHLKAQEFFQRPVVSLTLTDPRYYHLDTALAVLDDDQIMYNPSAFSPGSLAVLRDLFPDALTASDADAAVFGLNAVSDGYNVVLAQAATGLIEQLRTHGFHPIGVDLSELLKAGGGVKCCTLEIRTPFTAGHRTAAVPA